MSSRKFLRRLNKSMGLIPLLYLLIEGVKKSNNLDILKEKFITIWNKSVGYIP